MGVSAAPRWRALMPERASPPSSPVTWEGDAAFDDGLATFAVLSYADQNDRDYEAFLDAIRSGRVPAEPGR